MIIRKEQLDAFSNHVFDSFVQRMKVHLRRKYPKETGGRSELELERDIKSSVSRAHGFQIRLESNLVTFVEYATRYSMDFYTAAPFLGAQAVLERTNLNETEKMNRVNEYLVFG